MNNATATPGDCKECGTPLARKGAGPPPTYCSGRCRAKAGARRAKADGRYEEHKEAALKKRQAAREANAKPCPYCGDLMASKRRVQCGKPECKRLWTNERNLAWQHQHKAETGQWYSKTFVSERLHERTCETCGAQWQAKAKTVRFCSAPCRAYARAETERRRRLTAWLPVVSDWQPGLTSCSIPYRHPARRYDPGPRLFVQGNCIRCGTEFCVQVEAGIASYCSTRCQKSDGKAKRRATKRGAYVAHVYRSRIFERDKWTCRLCGKKIKRDEVVPHPLAPVIDHIVPLASGGTHEPANTQCAHFMCNSIKSDRGGGEQLMLIG